MEMMIPDKIVRKAAYHSVSSLTLQPCFLAGMSCPKRAGVKTQMRDGVPMNESYLDKFAEVCAITRSGPKIPAVGNMEGRVFLGLDPF